MSRIYVRNYVRDCKNIKIKNLQHIKGMPIVHVSRGLCLPYSRLLVNVLTLKYRKCEPQVIRIIGHECLSYIALDIDRTKSGCNTYIHMPMGE